jgi:hypothetical protein
MSEASNKPRRPRKTPGKDLALVAGPTADGEGAQVLRLRDGTLSAGELRPMREGQDLRARELVRLQPVEGHERAFEVEVLQEATTPDAADVAARSAGPARVSNPGYRRNYDRVFGARPDGDYSVN